MIKKYKRSINLIKKETGQVLVLVLLLMLLTVLVATPLLSHMSTGLKTGQVFEGKTNELYAADAGVEDGVWQIKYSHLRDNFPVYSAYNYNPADKVEYNIGDVNGYYNCLDPEYMGTQGLACSKHFKRRNFNTG
jgi:hypothetical protein